MTTTYKVPEHKWYELADHLTRMDEELAVIIRQLNTLIEKTGKMVEYLASITTIYTAPTPPPTPVQTITTIPAPVRIKEIREYNVGSSKDTEITIPAPVFVLLNPDGGDIYFNKIKTTSTSQNYKIRDGQAHAIYFAEEENRFYVRAVSGTVKVYVMLLEPIR